MVELWSTAEQRAEDANRFSDFSGFALRGAKQQVAELLETLGRVDGMFSTYTDHSIRHIDHMLGMLDWVIPVVTKEKMTPVDWLMITLGIYYHDVGMVITKKEFENRGPNREFQDLRQRCCSILSTKIFDRVPVSQRSHHPNQMIRSSIRNS